MRKVNNRLYQQTFRNKVHESYINEQKGNRDKFRTLTGVRKITGIERWRKINYNFIQEMWETIIVNTPK